MRYIGKKIIYICYRKVLESTNQNINVCQKSNIHNQECWLAGWIYANIFDYFYAEYPVLLFEHLK